MVVFLPIAAILRKCSGIFITLSSSLSTQQLTIYKVEKGISKGFHLDEMKFSILSRLGHYSDEITSNSTRFQLFLKLHRSNYILVTKVTQAKSGAKQDKWQMGKIHHPKWTFHEMSTKSCVSLKRSHMSPHTS